MAASMFRRVLWKRAQANIGCVPYDHISNSIMKKGHRVRIYMYRCIWCSSLFEIRITGLCATVYRIEPEFLDG